MARLQQLLLQAVATGVIGQGAAIRHREQSDAKGQG
jgi:hypothetical protein